jgi:hypothetical protein
VIPKLQADPAYQDGSTLIEITFDEGVSTNQTVATMFINPALSHVVVSQAATHYSTLKLNEDLLGVPELGSAATAPDIRTALGLQAASGVSRPVEQRPGSGSPAAKAVAVDDLLQPPDPVREHSPTG